MTLQVKFNPELLPPGYTDVQEPDDIDTPSVQSGHVQHSTEGMVIRVPVVPTHPPHIEIVPDRGAGSAAHPTIEIGSLLDVRLRLHVPIVVNLEQEDAFYIAKYDDLNEMGYGTDPIGAVEDLRQTLAELYWALKGDQERLGLDLADTWRKLSELVYEQ